MLLHGLAVLGCPAVGHGPLIHVEPAFGGRDESCYARVDSERLNR